MISLGAVLGACVYFTKEFRAPHWQWPMSEGRWTPLDSTDSRMV